MKVFDIPKSGKCGNMVWQRNRFAQYCYLAFVPFNPRTPAQVAVRGNFAAVSKRWRELTQAQCDIWSAVARTKKSKPRFRQCGQLSDCQFFVKINVALANWSLAQVDLPPEYPRFPQMAVVSPPVTSLANAVNLSPSRVIDGWQDHPPEFAALVPGAA